MVLLALDGNFPLCKGSLMYHYFVIFPPALTGILRDLPALNLRLPAAGRPSHKCSDFEHLGLVLIGVISIGLILGAVFVD